MTKRYRLKKDTPDMKAGQLFYCPDDRNYYMTERNYLKICEDYSIVVFYPDDPSFLASIVEGNSDWFEFVDEFKERIEVKILTYGSDGYIIQLPCPFTADLKNIPLIKEVVEMVLNGLTEEELKDIKYHFKEKRKF